MTNRPVCFRAAVLAAVIGVAATAEAGMYRYKDDNGRMVISNTVPQEATKRGYDILNNSGRVVVRAMHRKIRELEGLIQLKRGNISVISSQLDSEQSRAADMERAGRTIPDATLEKIRRLESQIRDLEREISIQTREINELKAGFEADIERLEEVTGKPRTITLDTLSSD